MRTILLISPYWKEEHRWMVSSVKLAELWQRLGYRVIVACMGAASGVERVSDTLTIHRRKDLFFPDPWNYGIALGFAGYVCRLAKREKPDLIVCNKLLFWTSLSVVSLRLRGYRVLLLADAFVGMTWHPRGFLPKIVMSLGAWTVGWLILLCAHHIVTFHPQPPSLLRRLGIAQKIQVIPTGIDPAPFQNVRITNHESPFDCAQGKRITITYIGRLESVKGVDDFLAAAVPLKKHYPQVRVQVVGWHRCDHPLVRQYEHDGIFTGLRDDIPEILRGTDIFVLPSYSEGLSNALMEAMASGCACIATEVGGNRLLIENGVSGFLFPPADREALKAHIRRLIEDPVKRRSLGENARRRIEEKFSWEVVGKRYQDLFTKFTIEV